MTEYLLVGLIVSLAGVRLAAVVFRILCGGES